MKWRRSGEPYTKIVDELPEMRRDTVELVKKARGVGELMCWLITGLRGMRR
jgi:hypothetical protein